MSELLGVARRTRFASGKRSLIVVLYTYASFDKGKAYGLEIKAEVPRIAALGLSGYLNYALGRVWFYNPITAGFTTEAAHLTDTSTFLAPMDQTHPDLRSDVSQHPNETVGRSGRGVRKRYPCGHDSGDHEHENGETHEHPTGPGLRHALPVARYGKYLDRLECDLERKQASSVPAVQRREPCE